MAETTTTPPPPERRGGSTPWLAFLVGVLLVAVIAFGVVAWQRQRADLQVPSSVDINLDTPRLPQSPNVVPPQVNPPNLAPPATPSPGVQ